ncbi:MAG: hypothetical protein KAH72_06115 [Flavobacteriaceae bacterium]|nr:hypothetical protein [Flavobacteriaceae bacterium]
MKGYKNHITQNDSYIRKQKVITVEEIKTKLGYSKRTINRRVVSGNLLISFNKNSKYYTLPSIPKFNKFGIWHYKEIGFSKYGNLYETVTKLIDNSFSGITVTEIKEILQVKNIYNALQELCNRAGIVKEKIGSTNVYFSAKEKTYELQYSKKTKDVIVKTNIDIFTEYQKVIEIFVIIILNNTLEISTIEAKLASKKINISRQEIDSVIEHYQLKKKKFK